MASQIYKIRMRSSMGIKRGTAEVISEDEHITLNILGSDSQFRGEFIPQNTFQLNGTLKTPFDALPATLQGSLSGELFFAVLATEKGTFPIEGMLLDNEDPSQAEQGLAPAHFQKG